jgi:hypothetical protein
MTGPPKPGRHGGAWRRAAKAETPVAASRNAAKARQRVVELMRDLGSELLRDLAFHPVADQSAQRRTQLNSVMLRRCPLLAAAKQYYAGRLPGAPAMDVLGGSPERGGDRRSPSLAPASCNDAPRSRPWRRFSAFVAGVVVGQWA